jgi:hypothetical protein
MWTTLGGADTKDVFTAFTVARVFVFAFFLRTVTPRTQIPHTNPNRGAALSRSTGHN